MIASMTGFGRGAAERDGLRVRAELRSVNSRFCDIQIRCGGGLQDLEGAIRERLQGQLTRGKVSVTVQRDDEQGAEELPALNEAVAGRYLRELQRLRQLGGPRQDPDWSALVRLPGLFSMESDPIDADRLQAVVLEAMEAALADFCRMRESEGAALERDLRQRVAVIEDRLEQIEQLAASGRAQLRERLLEKVRSVLEPGAVPEERLAMEVVLIAERADITEELVRFRSHNAQFVDSLEQGGEVGRRLNFLLQEMGREANTINSKASDARVVHLAVDVKEEVERLREQVQNLA